MLLHPLTPPAPPPPAPQVYIDLKEVATGSLEEDFDILPPKQIKVRALGRLLMPKAFACRSRRGEALCLRGVPSPLIRCLLRSSPALPTR